MHLKSGYHPVATYVSDISFDIFTVRHTHTHTHIYNMLIADYMLFTIVRLRTCLIMTFIYLST